MDNSETTLSERLIVQLTDPAKLNVYSLVLSAADVTHRIEYIGANEIAIYVAETKVEKALYELAAYDHENIHWPYIPPRQTFEPIFKAMSLIVITCLALLYYKTGEWSDKSIWFAKGAGDSVQILKNHEYFRLITSLSLHADLVHLLSNCILGGAVLHFFLNILGNGIGLTMLTVTATLATYINVIVHGPGHHFVGFSTAIFAVIGMLSTISFTFKSDETRGTVYSFIMPVMAGLALLAFLGSSGARTDLGAHLFGLLCGLLAGNIVRFRYFITLRNSFYLQTILGILPFIIFLYCWKSALSS